jgi:hypothetical protein
MGLRLRDKDKERDRDRDNSRYPRGKPRDYLRLIASKKRPGARIRTAVLGGVRKAGQSVGAAERVCTKQIGGKIKAAIEQMQSKCAVANCRLNP